MRALAVTCVVLGSAAASAHADSFLELAGGMSIPVGDSNWTKLADTSPNFSLRAGATGGATGELGGMLQVDWTPVNLDAMGGGVQGASLTFAAHRFRVLADAVLHHYVLPQLVISARAGIGVDIIHGSATGTLGTSTSTSSSTDTGLALELGGGIWYSLGTTQIGAELAIPIGNHSSQPSSNDSFAYQYASYDVDLLVGVRFISR